MTTAIIGIGNIGGIVARDLATGGEHVVLSAGNVDDVKKLAAEIGSLATAAETNRDAVECADNVVVALWLDAMKVVIPEVADLLRGKLVIDTSNPISVGGDGKVSRTLPDASRPVRSCRACSRAERSTPRLSEHCLRHCLQLAPIASRSRPSSFTPPTTSRPLAR